MNVHDEEIITLLLEEEEYKNPVSRAHDEREFRAVVMEVSRACSLMRNHVGAGVTHSHAMRIPTRSWMFPWVAIASVPVMALGLVFYLNQPVDKEMNTTYAALDTLFSKEFSFEDQVTLLEDEDVDYLNDGLVNDVQFTSLFYDHAY